MAGLVAALADGRLDLDPAGDAVRARAAMADLSGFGPWTVETVMMRAMADPDAFLPTDLGVVLAARRLGLPGTPAALRRHAERWRPWRSYAVQYLWATGEHPVNRLPPSGP
jgi:AraC family transcriptional regulator of adaptative response / DNA-3-methyladenine glycosylase II